MSASAVPIPLDQFALAIQELEIDLLHQEIARLLNSLHHLEASNTALEEYPDDPDCRDAIRYNIDVIHQQQQRVYLIKLELDRRGIRMDHIEASPTFDRNITAIDSRTHGNTGQGPLETNSNTGRSNTTPNSNGHLQPEEGTQVEEGVYL